MGVPNGMSETASFVERHLMLPGGVRVRVRVRARARVGVKARVRVEVRVRVRAMVRDMLDGKSSGVLV